MPADNDHRIAELGLLLGKAIAARDDEATVRLRREIDRLAGLDPDAPPSGIGRGSPGAMGLGTDQPSVRVKRGWRPPPKPDPMTSATRAGGRRRKEV